MDKLDVPPYPPPPPPKRPRPTITLQIPEATTPMAVRGPPSASPMYRSHPRYHGKPPGTATSHLSDPHGNPYFNPFLHMYHNKASDFMFKQFEGFKDFTMNTAKSGLSAGEKSAFWFYNKLSLLSKKWFTHLFLTLCLALYSVVGAAVFMALEGPNEVKYDLNLTAVRSLVANRLHSIVLNINNTLLQDPEFKMLNVIQQDLMEYEANYTECMKHINNNDVNKTTWTFWNSMFYAGTIFTTIGLLHMLQISPRLYRIYPVISGLNNNHFEPL